MSSLLFGASATVLATFVSVAIVLRTVALIAYLVAACRATRVEPVATLREE